MPTPPKRTASSPQSRGRNLATVGTVSVIGIEVPGPPKDLLKRTRDLWEAFWGSPLAALVDRASDRAALERLFGLYDERERSMRAVKKEGRLVLGSQGQSVLSPLIRYASECEKEIRQLEDRFGLTPMARLKLGVRFGQAAQSLDSLNDSLIHGDDEEETDPRLEVIDGSASDAG